MDLTTPIIPEITVMPQITILDKGRSERDSVLHQYFVIHEGSPELNGLCGNTSLTQGGTLAYSMKAS